MKILNVRTRTATGATAIVFLFAALGSGLLIITEENMLVRNLDSSGQLRINDIQSLLIDKVLPPEITIIGDDSGFVQLLDSSGAVISTTKNIAGEAALIAPPKFSGLTGEVVAENSIISAFDNVPFRLIAKKITVNQKSYSVIAGYSLVKTLKATHYLIKLLIALNLLVSMLVFIVTWFVTRGALRPVERMRSEVEELSIKDLSKRVSVPESKDEIGRLGRTLNSMLERLEISDQRQRRFVSDASHELRNPLAGMRTQLEVELLYPQSENVEQGRQALLRSTLRLQELTEDLLILAVSDSDTEMLNQQHIDLGEIVLQEVADFPVSPGVQLDTSGVETVRLLGDQSQLRRAFTNLLANANRFAESQITILVHSDNDWAYLEVFDDGPGIPMADRERVFERFSRLDNSRSRHAGGTGLGLAITKQIVLSHGGEIGLLEEKQGAHFQIRLPIESKLSHSII